MHIAAKADSGIILRQEQGFSFENQVFTPNSCSELSIKFRNMKRAVLVGIDKYPQGPLYGCARDAEQMGRLLLRHGNEDPNMEILIATQISTSAELLELITDLFSAERDLSVFYFSGHGRNDQGENSLVTPDVKKYHTGVSMDKIVELANASPASNRLIILDCCYSGAAGDGYTNGGSSIQIKKGVTILAASRHDQLAEMEDNQSIFSGLLIQALEGGAADIRGFITPASIYAYIDQALGQRGQRPVFKTYSTHFITLRQVPPELPPRVLRNIGTYFDKPDQVKQLSPEFEYTNTPDWKPLLIAPYADPEKVKVLQDLQKMQRAGLLVPVDADHLYFAAMENKFCKLTKLGQHFWKLNNEERI